ncbi:MAG: hypothetical protein RJA50_179 [Actinomycetota bacterium]
MQKDTKKSATARAKPIDLATCVEASLHTSLDGFDLPRARLYGVSIVNANGVASHEDGALRISFLAEHGDVYELLARRSHDKITMITMFQTMLQTTQCHQVNTRSDAEFD